MSRIIFAWELGSNYEYISQFLPLARELKSRGHDVALVVRELHHLRGIMADSGIPVLQAPLWLPVVEGLPEPPLNYAEILLRYGYHDAGSLAGVVNAWRALLMLYQTDLIIASHAPTALLAARTLGLPATVLGSGFDIPPDVAPTPNMRDWLQVPIERLTSSDAIVLNAINAILKACGKTGLKSVSELLDVAEKFLCTQPELDHYTQRAEANYWGGIYATNLGQELSWPIGNDEAPRVFVYLDQRHRDFLAVIKALTDLGCRALVCVPGIAEQQRKQLETASLVISDKPIKLGSVLDKCDLAICHSGHGITAQVLMAGVPMLMFPNHLEHYLLALRVQTMGAGKLVNLEAPPVDLTALIQDMLGTAEYKAQAQAFSNRYGNLTPAQRVAAIADRIEEIAAA